MSNDTQRGRAKPPQQPLGARGPWLAMAVVIGVLGTILYFEFRGTGGSGTLGGGFGVVEVPLALNATGEPASAETGRVAPDFRLEVLGGGEASLSEYRGQTVVLNFWASWCGPCRDEIPALQKVHSERPGLVFIGINQQENDAAAQRFIDEFGVTFATLMDRSGSVAREYRVTGPPLTVVVGPDGVIRRIFPGAIKERDLVEELDRMP